MNNKITKSERKIDFLYARKSSESEDRQVQSIDDQVERLKQLAANLNIEIKQIYTEAKSAKNPYNRPVFDEMMRRIEKGEANGILCWQINRLSRNPVDSGKLHWLLQQGVLKSIQTIDKEYRPDDNVLLFSVETGVANQFILDLSKNTKRGMESKWQKGWMTGIAPIGYLNDREYKTIVKDPERFDLVRKMWDLMLTGNYTPPRILQIATKEWGFRTRKFKRMGGGPMSRSAIYKVFTSLFYAGILEVNDNQYPGSHEKMVTLEEYDHVQKLLGRKGRPRPKTHKFAFTGALRCAVCGCFYTAETKQKIIKSTGEVREYTYYHCTRKTLKVDCDQRKNIREEAMNDMIKAEIEKYTILPQFLDWAMEEIAKFSDKEISQRSQMYHSQQKGLVETQNELDGLIQLRFRAQIDDETFARLKKPLDEQLLRLKEKRDTSEQRADRLAELSEKIFTYAAHSRSAFLRAEKLADGGLELKKDILRGLGNIAKIHDEKLIVEPMEWLVPIEKDYSRLAAEYQRLELEKTPVNTAQTDAFTSVRTQWLRG